RFHRPFRIAVEGNVGSGKTTFLRYFESISPDVEVFPEPLDRWNDVGGLRLFTAKIRLIERSIHSNRYVFTEANRRNGVISDGDCKVIDEYYKWSCRLPIFKLDLIVYLRSPPEVCAKRIRIRQRKGEDSMSIEFLRELHRLHEEWLLGEFSEFRPAPVVVSVSIS
ncbi:Deoxynucleoside kinase, partial [Taenia solium]